MGESYEDDVEYESKSKDENEMNEWNKDDVEYEIKSKDENEMNDRIYAESLSMRMNYDWMQVWIVRKCSGNNDEWLRRY